ncbi:MAG: RdgB/HAM1 family non-canonical purine NTP pyrophosphatase [Lachnospiraceae bacterium]|nr:RdgB/HAM1 family non-canonical purine NTP pyrophosphatase [Lachnospiraceae bacterium]
MEILFATTNQGKLREIRQILEEAGIDVDLKSLADLENPIDVEETGTTFEENSVLKANAYRGLVGENVIILADDSGLEVDALNKEPGIYSSRYMGVDTPYSEKNQNIIDRLEGVPDEERTARFVCVIAAALPDGTTKTVYETMEGRIAYKIAGCGGFGYDPIFFLPERGMTSAELTAAEKNAISHRGKALRKMCAFLKELNEK